MGRAATGKEADLVVVNGNPAYDVSILGAPGGFRAIIQNGSLVKGELNNMTPNRPAPQFSVNA